MPDGFLCRISCLALIFTCSLPSQAVPPVSSKLTDAARTQKLALFKRFRAEGAELCRQLEYAKAAEAFTKALEVAPVDTRTLEDRADAYEKIFMLDKAAEDIQLAIKLLPSYGGYRRHLGRIYYKAGKLPKAVAEYTEAIKLEPSDIGAFRERGRIYKALGQDQNAIADFERFIAVERDDHNGEIVHMLGELCLKTGNTKRALEVFNMEIKIVPDLPGGYHGRARTYVRMGRKDLAQKDEKTAWEIEKSY